MKNWSSVKKLHIEISSKCNAACPMCARYPTSSYYEHPFIQDDWMWNLDTVKDRLPPADIAQMREILINGTIGDFISNQQALEIVQYLNQSAPVASILINTNGSARNATWWKELAKIPDTVVNFAIDGLEDTHALYRRNTSWSKIISNAKTFIEAGGVADWTMIVFDHNKHQVEKCRALSKELGFRIFQARNSDRMNTFAIGKDGQLEHFIKSPDNKLDQRTFQTLKFREYILKSGIFRSVQQTKSKALPSLDLCESLSDKSIYIGSNWAVMPCCFYGAITVNRELDHRWNNFSKALTEKGLTPADFIATDTKTVRQIFEQGFEWIYDKILTDNALVACYQSCHPKDGAYQRSWAGNQKINFDKVVQPTGIEPVSTGLQPDAMTTSAKVA
jgi:MoaA/NifB/PqqE/SkfB family radical SAM enzyme